MRALLLQASVALLIGAAQALTFAPWRLWWLAPCCLLMLLRLAERQLSCNGWAGLRRFSLCGLCYGLGLALCGSHWLYLAIYQGGHNPWVAVSLAAVLMLLFALHYAALFGLSAWLATGSAAHAYERYCLLFFPACWVLSEWLRRATDYDFPWFVLGESQVPGGIFSGFAPVGGAFAASYLLLLGVGAVAVLLRRRRQPSRVLGTACLMLLALAIAGDQLLRRQQWSEMDGAAIHAVVLQSMQAGGDKWHAGTTRLAMRRVQTVVLRNEDSLIVTPETMLDAPANLIPASFWDGLHDGLAQRHSYLLLGVPTVEQAGETLHIYNSVLSLGPGGAELYRKQHLVPVAEHMPFKETLGGFYRAALHYPLQDQSPGEAAWGKPLFAAGHMFAPLICYDAAYGAQAARETVEANVIVNLSDDSWIDSETYFAQTEQMAQARALETARPLLRSNNMGHTAAIDAQGNIIAAAPARSEAELRVTLTGRAGTTPYMRLGDMPVLILAATAILAGLLPWRRMLRPSWRRRPLADMRAH